MKKGSITTYRLDPKKKATTDWTKFDAMTEEERHAAALSDPDCQPTSEAGLKQFRRRIDVRALRKQLGLTQHQFATRFRLPLGTIRDWEQGTHWPDRAAHTLLTVIARDPDAVTRALEEEATAK